MTVAEIAEHYRVTETTVAGILNVPVRERRLHDVAVLHRRGLGRIEIGRLLDLRPGTISLYLRELANQGEIESTACPHCGR